MPPAFLLMKAAFEAYILHACVLFFFCLSFYKLLPGFVRLIIILLLLHMA